MSLPVFPNPETILSREEAIQAILTSIAMEEAALSHILNAEGEKIQYAVAHAKANPCEADMHALLEINKSASSLVEKVTDMQMILKNKMRLAVDSLPPIPAPPHPPPHPCVPPRHAPRPESCQYNAVIFSVPIGYIWRCGGGLLLRQEQDCSSCIRLCQQCGGASIILPAGKRYKVEYMLEFCNECMQPVTIEMKLLQGNMEVQKRVLFGACGKKFLTGSGSLILQMPSFCERSSFSIRLLSGARLKVMCGRICITELNEVCP